MGTTDTTLDSLDSYIFSWQFQQPYPGYWLVAHKTDDIEYEVGVVVGGGAVVANERPDVGSNRAAAASAGDPVLVPRVLTEGEGRC